MLILPIKFIMQDDFFRIKALFLIFRGKNSFKIFFVFEGSWDWLIPLYNIG